MSETEYGIWLIENSQARVIPAGASRYWAEKRAARHQADGAKAGVVYRYTFMPDMPWVDATTGLDVTPVAHQARLAPGETP